MADTEPEAKAVINIAQLVEGYDDAEHLYWETRRLLDERFRADWAAVNLYAVIYREKNVSVPSRYLFQQLMGDFLTALAFSNVH